MTRELRDREQFCGHCRQVPLTTADVSREGTEAVEHRTAVGACCRTCVDCKRLTMTDDLLRAGWPACCREPGRAA